MGYDQARADFEYLETLAELSDFVEIDASVIDLMRNPTKAKAAELYEAAIRLWLGEHEVAHSCVDPEVRAIAERLGA